MDKEGNSPFLSDAPNDSVLYGRKNKQWVRIENSTETGKISPLANKYIYSIGDSHTYAYMQRLAELTGAVYDADLHKQILSGNEKLPGVHTMCTQAHAIVEWYKKVIQLTHFLLKMFIIYLEMVLMLSLMKIIFFMMEVHSLLMPKCKKK